MKGFDRPTAVMVFHVNKDHSEVGWNVYRRMVEGGEFLQMLRGISVPIELSIQGEDVSFLATAEPEIVKEMLSNPKISVLQGSYTHTLPSFFPEMLPDQITLSKKILKHFLGEKLSWVGALPEVDVSTPIIPSLKKVGWEGVLVLEDLHYTYEYRKETNIRIPLIDEAVLRSEGMPLIVATGAELRNIYHRFYRGFTAPEDFLKALEAKAIRSKVNFVVFYTDFEVPQINAVEEKSRIDLWEKFFQLMGDSPIHFCHFREPEVKQFIQNAASKARETQIELRPMAKWHHSTKLYEKIEETIRKNSSVDPRILFRLTISDTFSAIYYWPMCAELPVKGSNKIVIKPDLARRIEALNYFLAKSQEGEVPLTFGDQAFQWYLNKLEQAHRAEPP